jgi:hypothetical protein
MSFRGMINIYRSQLFQKLQVPLSARNITYGVSRGLKMLMVLISAHFHCSLSIETSLTTYPHM